MKSSKYVKISIYKVNFTRGNAVYAAAVPLFSLSDKLKSFSENNFKQNINFCTITIKIIEINRYICYYLINNLFMLEAM